jgi:hypothetical protein
MSEPIDRPDAGQPARRSLNSFSPFPKSDPRNERKGLRPLGEDPAGTEDLRIHEDPSTVISLGGAGVQSGTNPSTSTSTPTQPPADEAEIQAQRDRDRLLALRLLDLEWTSLPPEIQQATVMLLHAVTKGR